MTDYKLIVELIDSNNQLMDEVERLRAKVAALEAEKQNKVSKISEQELLDLFR